MHCLSASNVANEKGANEKGATRRVQQEGCKRSGTGRMVGQDGRG